LEQLQANYGDQVRIVWRDLPIITPQSPKAAEAAQCAYDQGRFWDYHDLLFVQAPNLGVRNLKSYAVELGLDEDVFNQCLDSGTHADTVDLDKRDAFRRGLRGTPSFLINDQPLIGANPTLMVQMIDSIIASQQ
jgi:protein-disulfide isomerase